MIKQPIVLFVSLITSACLILALSQTWLAPRITANKNKAKQHILAEAIDPHSYNNDLLHSAEALNERMTVYRASLDQKVHTILLETSTSQGYNGKITLLLTVRADQSLAGVRILQHQETPGLGDKIELKHSPWILNFTDKSLQHPRRQDWRVKKDGGVFDSWTGATITPRAVVEGVAEGLEFIQSHYDYLFTNQINLKNHE